MTANDATFKWPDEGLTRIPYSVYQDADVYAAEQARIYRGPVWNFLCLTCELPNPGDYRVTQVGETPVIVTRDNDHGLNAFVNRCAHRGALLCLDQCGNTDAITCVYHAWRYTLKGELASVSFHRGVNRKGGMPNSFDKSKHGLETLRVTEFCGLIFGTFDPETPDIEDYLGPEIATRIKRVLKRPQTLLGENTQILDNNWKLYFENVKDSYHASLLHLFFTTFRINRLGQKGGVVVDESGGHHASYSIMDKNLDNSSYTDQNIRSADDGVQLTDPSMLDSVDEIGDGVTLQILTVFPGLVVQQIQNAIAVRQVVPTGVEKTLLNWRYIGFADDDADMTERRLKQANLVGPAGYVSLEDGAVGGFVQRGIAGSSDAVGVVEMGGDGFESQDFRATETSVRGMWRRYRDLMGF
ncbi:MAG: aromatic ring-hydroxylating dioxygenase subunit alpha [Alphaproteobacteria bacterium]|nr:aromatic ring-hydroxylating dioxygenase subunit alpha [Alphaproteobacteria bacterium]